MSGLTLPEAGRSEGIHVLGTRGAGKSLFLGRIIAYHDFLQGKPLIFLDPTGKGIDFFLHRLRSHPDETRLYDRLRYVETSGRYGYVMPMATYFKRGNDRLLTQAQRVLTCFRQLDPNIDNIPMLGWNALRAAGEAVGMICAHLGYQITEAEAILADPEPWLKQIEGVAALRDAAAWLAKYKKDLPAERGRNTASFLNKVNLFHDEPMKAMFGANKPGIDWDEVLRKKLAVLVDFRYEGTSNVDALRFKMLWIYRDLINFLQTREGAREQPVSLIIDEVSHLMNNVSRDLEMEIDQFINTFSRNVQVQLTMAHQEMYQISEGMQSTLLKGLKTQFVGPSADIDGTYMVVKRFYQYDPTWVKKEEDYWKMDFDEWSNQLYRKTNRSAEFTIAEQLELNAQNIMDLPGLTFLAAITQKEGDLPKTLEEYRIKKPSVFPDEATIGKARRYLAKRDGVAITTALAEINARKPPESAQKPVAAARQRS